MILDLSSKKSLLSSDDLLAIRQKLKEAFSQIREEFEDHLSAINDNTSEIQSNFQYISELDAKLDKIDERIDRIEMFLEKTAGFELAKKPKFDVKPLTRKEEEIFLILYTFEEKGSVTYRNIARNAGLPEDLVQTYITSMVQKGIPIRKRYISNKAFIKLDPAFKALQAKENILKIGQKTLL